MIHKYEQNGSYIVLDICSGGVHVVDKLVYDLLDYAKPPFMSECPTDIIEKMSDYDENEVAECYLELKELYDAKMLYTDDDYAK